MQASPSQYSEIAGFVTREVIQQIVQLLHSDNSAVAETAAILLALCCAGQDQVHYILVFLLCRSHRANILWYTCCSLAMTGHVDEAVFHLQQSWALEAGGLAGVLPLVSTVEPRRYREAGAAALSALIWNNRAALETAMAHPGLLQDLLACMKQPQTPGGAFHAAACLTSLTEVLLPSSDPSPQVSQAQNDQCKQECHALRCQISTYFVGVVILFCESVRK